MSTQYALNHDELQPAAPQGKTLNELWELIAGQKLALSLTFLALLINTAMGLWAPVLVAYVIDNAIDQGNFSELLRYAVLLLGVYSVAFVANYQQVLRMGTVGQQVLFDLRNRVFQTLQDLPLAFFQANRAGDLISRINNDTSNLSTLFSETLVRLVGSFVIMAGAAGIMIVLNWQLGLVALAPAVVLWAVTHVLSPWVRKKNALSLVQTGDLSSQIQESLENFKIIVAFERRDYFRDRFAQANASNYEAARDAGIANQVFSPIYSFMSQLAQLGVLGYGIYLLTQGQLTVGLLVAYFTYVSRFYDPLRQVAMLWSSFQLSLASWQRIRDLLDLENPMRQLPQDSDQVCQKGNADTVLAFESVSFAYQPEGPNALNNVNFQLEQGKTYAFVGPTGGGKSTTAGLMSRLFDPVEGHIRFHGEDLRCLSSQERADKIAFILQDPFLFAGTIADNLRYGQKEGFDLYAKIEQLQLHAVLESLWDPKDKLATAVDNLSLGQKQLIAFVRAVLKDPELLILDEATANIDTATEALLERALTFLPPHTTRVIIAHRLNTIENADVIFFVNAGEIQQAGNFEDALNLLLSGARNS